jgi:hypothetical protein
MNTTGPLAARCCGVAFHAIVLHAGAQEHSLDRGLGCFSGIDRTIAGIAERREEAGSRSPT